MHAGDRTGAACAKPWVLAAAAYVFVTIVMTWPLAARLGSVLPHDRFDPALNTWILWWDAHAIPFTARWWSPPFFWPMDGALALSEHLLGISVLTTPLQWLGCGPVAAYNVAFLASFPFAALAMHGLVFTLVRRHDAGVLAGLAFAYGPYRVAQIAHIQVLWMFGAPLALLALHRYRMSRRSAWLLLFAAAWLMQALSNGYMLMMLPVLLGVWAIWHVDDLRQLASIGVAWLLASLPLMPILAGYSRIQHTLALERSYEEIQSFSADLAAIVSRGSQGEDQLFPGVLVLGLIAAGGVIAARERMQATAHSRFVGRGRWLLLIGASLAIAAAVSSLIIRPWALSLGSAVRLVSVSSPEKPLALALLLLAGWVLSSARVNLARRERSPFAFYVLAAAAMLLLALGPHPRLHGYPIVFHGPYWWLLQLPGFDRLRVPARFGGLFELCAVAAAAVAFARLTGTLSVRGRVIATGAAAVMILGSAWPATTVLAELPPAISMVAAESNSVTLLELPGGGVESDTAAMFRSLWHRLPLVNGYSGYSPMHYVLLRTGLAAGDERVLDPFARDRDLLVAINRAQAEPWSSIVARHPRAALVRDDGEWRVYRIAKAPGVDAPADGTRLQIVAVDTPNNPEGVARLLDGDADTSWNTGRQQVGNEQLTIDLGRACGVSVVRLQLGTLSPQFPRRLVVDCASDRGDWQTCWNGSAAALAVEGALANARNVEMTIRLDRPAVRRIRLRQTASTAVNTWSIAELMVFGKTRP